MINGVWKPWSEERRFNVEAYDTDCLQWNADLISAVDANDEVRVAELLATEWVMEVQKVKEYEPMRPDLQIAFGKAVKKGNIAMIRKLIDAGASVTGSASSENSILTAAIEGRQYDIVVLLLEKGADKVYSSKPPLYAAAESGQIEIVRLLLKRGAKPNQSDFEFNKPLIAAVKNGHLEVVRALLEAKASPDVYVFGGDSALQISKQKGFKEIEALLKTYGARY